MASGGINLDPVTQCPFCEHPVHNSDELQVHYLTSCSVMASGGNLDPITLCPLCEHPVHNSDELQVHYLTSCSDYDGKGNQEG